MVIEHQVVQQVGCGRWKNRSVGAVRGHCMRCKRVLALTPRVQMLALVAPVETYCTGCIKIVCVASGLEIQDLDELVPIGRTPEGQKATADCIRDTNRLLRPTHPRGVSRPHRTAPTDKEDS